MMAEERGKREGGSGGREGWEGGGEGDRRLQMEGLHCRGGLPRKSLSSHFICVCLAREESNCM